MMMAFRSLSRRGARRSVRNFSSHTQGFMPVYPHWQASVRRFASGQGKSFNVVVPFMGKSVQDGTIASFLKKPGDQVKVYDVVAQIDTDKVTVHVQSSGSGVLEKLVMNEGDTVTPGTVVAIVTPSKSSSRAKESDSSPADARGPDAPSTAKVPDTPAAAKSPEVPSAARTS